MLDDADPVHVAKGAMLFKFLNTGQACISPNRLFIHRSILKPFIDEMKNRILKMKAGNGLSREGGREGVFEYLETKLTGFSV